MVSGSPGLLIALIALAILFDFLNGLHDAANSIATVVSTRVLSPHTAVAWAAFFFIAFLFFGLHVAQTIGTGIISAETVDWRVVFGLAAWAHHVELDNMVGRIPSSSSHALIGGMLGARVAKEVRTSLYGQGGRNGCCRRPFTSCLGLSWRFF